MPRTKQFDEVEILNKAVELFWEKGFHATSIQDLVDHLGINRASIYNTYGGKNVLFDQALQNYRDRSSEMLKRTLYSETNTKEGFRKLFEIAIKEVETSDCNKGCFVVNTITELVPGDAPLKEKLKQNSVHTESLFSEYIQMGIDNGSISTTKKSTDLAFTLFTLFSGLRVMAKLEENSQKLNRMIETGLSILD